jgi:integrase
MTMAVKVVRPTYLDKKTGKRCKLDYYVQVCAGGERYLRRVGTRDAAYEKKKEIEDSLKDGTHTMPDPEPVPASEKITFRKFAETWMTGTVANNLKWNTKRYYTDMLKRIPDSIQDRPFDEITREDVRNIVFGEIEKGRARSTATGIIRTISTIYTYAAEDGVYRGANIAENPSRILRQDNGSEEVEDDQIDSMDRKESEDFLKVVKKHFGSHYPIFLTGLMTGARQGEQIGLQWGDIDWKKKFITIRRTVVNGKVQSTKNRQSRRIPIPDLVKVLKAYEKAMASKALAAGKPMSPWIFPAPEGGVMDPSKLRKEFAAALKKAEIRALEHRSLRNTALTIMAESGVPITALQRIAGHSSIEVTARFYLKVQPEDHAATLAALSAMGSVWNANGDANESGNDVLLGKI